MIQQPTRKAISAGLVIACLTLALLRYPHVAHASGPLVTFTPASAGPGSSFTIVGSGFQPSEIVTLYWNGSPVANNTTSNDGTSSFNERLSGTAPAGSRSVTIKGDRGDQAFATFMVLPATAIPSSATPIPSSATPIPPSATPVSPSAPSSQPSLTLSPASAAPGSPFTISGSGFAEGETINLLWNGTIVAQIGISNNGSFSYPVSLSTSARPGTRLVAAQGTTGDTANATFTILDPVTAPTPAVTPPATTVPVQPSATAQPTATTGPTSGNPSSGATNNGCAITADQTQGEQRLFNLLNADRAAAGAPALALDETVSTASRAHSCDMFEHQQLNHDGSDGSSPFQRIAATGVTYDTAGENIGMSGGRVLNDGIDIIDNEMMAELLSEGNHHWNIVNANYKRVGIGVIYANGQVWLTEDFIG